MQTCIVRQPIMNREKKVAAYEVLFQEDESSLYNQQDSRAANAIQDFFMGLDQNNFLGDKDAFITFTPNLLMKNIPR
ncbi:MAG TPA: diguanylate phosphodiesterase, partial [Ruminococcaceae bacterium]|nr:diguanylate phosphodiesterase [Oscillospiraceae bacterium]